MRLSAIIITATLLLAGYSASAQTTPVNPRSLRTEAGFYTGGMVSIDNGAEAGAMFGATYASYSKMGIGFRGGMMYSNYGNVIAMPMGIAYKSSERSDDSRLISSGISAANSVWHQLLYTGHVDGRGALANFLSGLVSSSEIHAGITPGIMTREMHPLEVDGVILSRNPNQLYLTLDAGATISYRLWRVDFMIIPEYHYNLTKCFKTPGGNGAFRSFVSICAGLGFRF